MNLCRCATFVTEYASAVIAKGKTMNIVAINGSPHGAKANSCSRTWSSAESWQPSRPTPSPVPCIYVTVVLTGIGGRQDLRGGGPRLTEGISDALLFTFLALWVLKGISRGV